MVRMTYLLWYKNFGKKLFKKKEKRKRKHDWSKKLYIQRFSFSSYPVSWTEFVDRCCKATFIPVTILRNIIMADLSDSVAPNACFSLWYFVLGNKSFRHPKKGRTAKRRTLWLKTARGQCGWISSLFCANFESLPYCYSSIAKLVISVTCLYDAMKIENASHLSQIMLT